MQSREAPLELIVHQLPEATSDESRVFRKRLYQWIDQGVLKLYQTTEHSMPIICLSSLQQNPIGLALGASSNGDLTWFQTRSKQGIEHFLDQLEALKQNASLVSPDTLNDPDTVIIFPDPTWQNLSLEDLRQRLGLSQILHGSIIQRIAYFDRYLYRKGAKLLSRLLEGDWLDQTTQIEINTLEGRDEDINQRTITLKTELKKLEKSRLTLNVTAFGSTQHFSHARVLEVYRSDHQAYKVIFDKGIDFIGYDPNGSYFVKEPTYIVILLTRQ